MDLEYVSAIHFREMVDNALPEATLDSDRVISLRCITRSISRPLRGLCMTGQQGQANAPPNSAKSQIGMIKPISREWYGVNGSNSTHSASGRLLAQPLSTRTYRWRVIFCSRPPRAPCSSPHIRGNCNQLKSPNFIFGRAQTTGVLLPTALPNIGVGDDADRLRGPRALWESPLETDMPCSPRAGHSQEPWCCCPLKESAILTCASETAAEVSACSH